VRKLQTLKLSIIIILAYSFVDFIIGNNNSVAMRFQAVDAETKLSLGLPLELTTVGIYELTLLDRVSDRIAMNLTNARRRLIEDVTKGVPLKKSLQSVKGIGKKGSKYLAENLKIEIVRLNQATASTDG